MDIVEFIGKKEYEELQEEYFRIILTEVRNKQRNKKIIRETTDSIIDNKMDQVILEEIKVS
jgi:hypothetical protein